MAHEQPASQQQRRQQNSEAMTHKNSACMALTSQSAAELQLSCWPTMQTLPFMSWHHWSCEAIFAMAAILDGPLNIRSSPGCLMRLVALSFLLQPCQLLESHAVSTFSQCESSLAAPAGQSALSNCYRLLPVYQAVKNSSPLSQIRFCTNFSATCI